MPEQPRPTILIVDDTEASRYAVSRILRQARFEVREATNGADALRLAKDKPDLMILDVSLPDISGHVVCQRLKADPATASMPILHLSASFVRSEDRAEGLEGGADGYLTYPLEPRELIANVQALLRIRQAERAARDQHELLRVTLGSIGDGVVATDLAGIVTFINPVAQGLTGWSEAEAIGKPLRDVFHIVNEESGQPAENPIEKLLRSGKKVSLANHVILVARDGTRRPIDDTADPILNGEGRCVGVVLVFRDVSERRRLEGEVQQRAAELVERDRRKDEFLAILAHELRNPLAPIANTLGYLKLKLARDPEYQEQSQVLERQVAHLTRLVEDLMDVSRITRGKFELRKEQVELATIVRLAIESVRSVLEERRHHLEVSLPPEPLVLEADPARLEQVLTNLLTNAGKYTPPGGTIGLKATREGAEAVIQVWDNGIGIRPEMVPRLFEMFQQADRIPGRVAEGLGLGLALVRNLVKMHGGSVSASSPGAGQGSEFVLRLPLLGSGTRPTPRSTGSRENRSSRQLRVLVTDDNRDSATSMALLLRLNGHEVQIAHDGPQALVIAKQFRPEVVFLDIGLPLGMDGYEVARRLRREVGLEQTMLVAMTGYGQPEDVRLAHAAGFDHHVTKPAEPGTVEKLLATVSQGRSGS